MGLSRQKLPADRTVGMWLIAEDTADRAAIPECDLEGMPRLGGGAHHVRAGLRLTLRSAGAQRAIACLRECIVHRQSSLTSRTLNSRQQIRSASPR